MGAFMVNASVQSYNSSNRVSGTLTLDGTAGKGEAAGASEILSLSLHGIIVIRALGVYIPTAFVCAAGTLASLGTESSLAEFIANTNAQLMHDFAMWASATPSYSGGALTPATAKDYVMSYDAGATSIAMGPTVHNITGGQIQVFCLYDALVPGSTLTSTSGVA